MPFAQVALPLPLRATFTYRNTTLRTQKVRVVVTGYSLITKQGFTMTGTPLGAPVDEGIAALTINLF